MAVIFEETQDIIPNISLKILILIIVATEVFIAACCALDYTAWWQFGLLTLVFVIFFCICYFVKIRITVTERDISVRMLKTFTVPLDHVIDVKKGDIDIMRNYSGWGIKKVKFKNYAAPGIDGAVSAKLTGRTVLTVTTRHVDELYDILMENRRKD